MSRRALVCACMVPAALFLIEASAWAQTVASVDGASFVFAGSDFGPPGDPGGAQQNYVISGTDIIIDLANDVSTDDELFGFFITALGTPGMRPHFETVDNLQIEASYTVHANNASAGFLASIATEDSVDPIKTGEEFFFEFSLQGDPIGQVVNKVLPLAGLNYTDPMAPDYIDRIPPFDGMIGDGDIEPLNLERLTFLTEPDTQLETHITLHHLRLVDLSTPFTVVGIDGETPPSFTFGSFPPDVAQGDAIVIEASGPGGVGYNQNANFDAEQAELVIEARLLPTNTASSFQAVLQDIDLPGDAVPDPENPPANPRQIDDHIFDIATSLFNPLEFTTVRIPLGNGTESAIEAAFQSNPGDGLQNFGLTQIRVQNASPDLESLLGIEISRIAIEVPEPGTLALLVVGAVIPGWRRTHPVIG